MKPFLELLQALGACVIVAAVGMALAPFVRRLDFRFPQRTPEARKGLRKER